MNTRTCQQVFWLTLALVTGLIVGGVAWAIWNLAAGVCAFGCAGGLMILLGGLCIVSAETWSKL
jgi:hypothetical protein